MISLLFLAGTEVLVLSVPGYPELEVLSSTALLVFGTIIPFTIILASNLVIIVTVKKASMERFKLSGRKKTDAKDAHMTRMLIFVSVAYVITSLPHRLYILILDIPEVSNLYRMEETYWNLRYNVQLWATFNLWLFGFAINFYLYCLGGGAKYRKDTKAVVLGLCIRHQ